jgi:hypothetical protein
MVVLALHGEAGGWDELIIAIVAFGVLWLAVRLAGRKSADDDEEEAELAHNNATAHHVDERPADAAPPTGSNR